MSPSPSPVFIALLRGINVGGKRSVPMKALAEVFADTGCEDVRTLIQSGNVVFRARASLEKRLPAKLEAALEKGFGFPIPLVLRTRDALEKVARNNPFLHRSGGDPGGAHVLFLAHRPTPSQVAALDPGRGHPDAFEVVGSEVYLWLPGGVARSKLTNAYFDRVLETTGTLRNWRTVQKLLALSGLPRAL